MAAPAYQYDEDKLRYVVARHISCPYISFTQQGVEYIIIIRTKYVRNKLYWLVYFNIFLIFFGGIFIFLFVQYSALLHLPPLRFHCADGCWDRTQDRCNWCIDSQTL